MRLFDEQTSAERLSAPRFSHHHLPEQHDKQLSSAEFPAVLYLLMKQKQSSELIDFSFSMEPSVAKWCRSSVTHEIMSICSKGCDAVRRNDSLRSVPLDGKLQIQSELRCSSREKMRNLFFALDVSDVPLGALLVNNLPSCDEGGSRESVSQSFRPLL
ncbi:hypothetical protein D9C73_021459 [Collichthys lucidus]|uniref:Uncharacterized protein n=1 Tax=Collichthys lucidus TaxID=240159 RepID=A0A4U5VJN3_COLLU|nr:hypothetical protein D9C73_021459 [Collichthys lucidus]